jgi:pantoate--beta-alanine ligase
MKVLRNPKLLTDAMLRLRNRRKRIGFVPTMGCLHEGHLSLVRRARKENEVVVVSIFVNPAQFGPREDFKRYPRQLKQDRKLLKREHVDYLFIPSRQSMYPKGFRDVVEPGPMNKYLCGPKRPGHFRGVATVVKRLFQMVRPCAAYFGEKDFQQARIIEEMVRRIPMPVRIKTCPIVREADGLAMSSRNRYLSKSERVRARALYRSLVIARNYIDSGERDAGRVKKVMRNLLLSYANKIDYAEAADPKTCAPLKRMERHVLLALACYVGRTRLIDNLVIRL